MKIVEVNGLVTRVLQLAYSFFLWGTRTIPFGEDLEVLAYSLGWVASLGPFGAIIRGIRSAISFEALV